MRIGIEQVCLSRRRQNRSLPHISVNTIDQVKRHGQITPVVVRPLSAARYEIVANAESWLSVQKAGLFEVEVLVRDDLSDEQAADIINHGGDVLDPISEAEWFRESLDTGWQGRQFESVAELARFVGVSRSYVAHARRLLELSPAIQEGIRAGAIKVGHAKAILSIRSAATQATFAASLIRERWSVRRAETEARLLRQGDLARVQRKSANTQALEKDIGEHLGSDVNIDEKAGVMTIDFCKDPDVLDGVLRKMGFENSRSNF